MLGLPARKESGDMPKRSNPAFWLMTLGNGGTPVLFNEAVGGTITEVADYNGTGQTWRVHTFTSSGSLEVLSDADPNGFRVLVVGGGGSGGGGGGGDNGGGGGGGGGLFEDSAMSLTSGSHTITVGSGGQSTTAFGYTMLPGGNGGGGGGAGAGGANYGSGGGGGAPGAGGGGNVSSGQGGNGGNAAAEYNGGSGGHGGTENAGQRPGTPHVSDITGASTTYAKGGPEGYNAGYHPAPTLYGEGGRGGNNRGGAPGGGPLGGYQGVVIVAYQIG